MFNHPGSVFKLCSVESIIRLNIFLLHIQKGINLALEANNSCIAWQIRIAVEHDWHLTSEILKALLAAKDYSRISNLFQPVMSDRY